MDGSMRRRTWLGLALASAAAPFATARAQGASLVIFAAASLKNALDEIVADWVKASGKSAPKISYAASSALAKQLEQGAPADLFISADLDWMDYVAEKKLIKPDTRKTLLGNQLVLVAAKDSGIKLELKPQADLLGTLAGGKLAVGDVKAVPAGKYAKAALEKLSLWASVEASLAQAENVRAALALVARGEAKLGIVYATDAKVEPAVKIVGTFPADSHPAIVYPVAATANAKPEAADYLSFLRSAAAKGIFEKYGFGFLVSPTT